MSLKKYLIRLEQNKAQVLMEYFILLTLIAVLTMLAGQGFFKHVKNSAYLYQCNAIEKMNPDFMEIVP